MGDPPTYCYVGQATLEGKNHLYISFVCIDPDVRKIRADWNGAWGNPPRVTWDDSVEIFLDVNGDRNDYHQMIVNTRPVSAAIKVLYSQVQSPVALAKDSSKVTVNSRRYARI